MSPSEAEVLCIIEAAGKSSKNYITATELELALQLWDSYVEHRTEIELLSHSCDCGGGKRLNFDQLKLYLSNLKVRPPKVAYGHGNFSDVPLVPLYCLLGRTLRSAQSCTKSTESTAST